MFMKKLIYLFSLCLLLASCGHKMQTQPSPASFVNPLMGTSSTFAFSHGNTYPAVAAPWGMNFWSPQTEENGSGWMYMYTDSLIRGFRQTHQPSPWINDYGTFSIMPLLGKVIMDNKSRGVGFRHENEKAAPNCYQVKFDNGVTTALSATSRGAVFEVTYPSEEGQYIVIDAYQHGGNVALDAERNCIYGTTRYNNGGVPDNFGNHFILEFDKPIVESGTDENACAYVGFHLKAGEKLTIRVASSFINHEQARLNLDREVRGRSFAEVSAAAKKVWDEQMGRIKVEGGTEEQQKTFYSCLYRTLLFPREFYEFDKNEAPVYYSPYDGQIHNGYMYTDNGFWDTFRAVHPLFTLVYPEVSERIMQSIVNAYSESGFMPEWASPGHRGCMIGNNSISLLTDAWMKGIRTFDKDKALEAMLNQTRARSEEISSVGRDGYAEYDRLGYVPYPEVHEATAKTLEYAYADWCLARFAEKTGHQEVAAEYYKKAQNYRNLFYPEKGFMWAKDANGKWRDNFDATEWGGPFTEGCSWHWTWSVFHDPEGLSSLLGGHELMAGRLDSMFVAPNTFNYGTYGFVIHEIAEMVALNMGQYAHGNQPVQHAIYLYNYVGQPWKAQYHTRNVMNKLYNSGPEGYCGDEDNGQTSAWYVFTALGFYPVCPGASEYVLGSPLFPKATLSLPGEKTFTIHAEGVSDTNCYIRSAELNAKGFTRNYLKHEELVGGGEFRLVMDSVPNRERGIHLEDFPYSYSK